MAFMLQFLKYLWRPLLDIFKVQNKNRAFKFLRQPCTFSFNILADFHWTLTTLSLVCANPSSSQLWLRVSHIKLKILDAFSGHSRSFDLSSSFFTSSFDILPFFTFRLIFSLTRSSNVFLWLYFCRFNFILFLLSFCATQLVFIHYSSRVPTFTDYESATENSKLWTWFTSTSANMMFWVPFTI